MSILLCFNLYNINLQILNEKWFLNLLFIWLRERIKTLSYHFIYRRNRINLIFFLLFILNSIMHIFLVLVLRFDHRICIFIFSNYNHSKRFVVVLFSIFAKVLFCQSFFLSFTLFNLIMIIRIVISFYFSSFFTMLEILLFYIYICS